MEGIVGGLSNVETPIGIGGVIWTDPEYSVPSLDAGAGAGGIPNDPDDWDPPLAVVSLVPTIQGLIIIHIRQELALTKRLAPAAIEIGVEDLCRIVRVGGDCRSRSPVTVVVVVSCGGLVDVDNSQRRSRWSFRSFLRWSFSHDRGLIEGDKEG